MPLPSFEQLHREAGTSCVPVAVAGAADSTVIEALGAAADRGWVEPILVGPVADVRRAAEGVSRGLHGCRLVDAAEPPGRQSNWCAPAGPGC